MLSSIWKQTLLLILSLWGFCTLKVNISDSFSVLRTQKCYRSFQRNVHHIVSFGIKPLWYYFQSRSWKCSRCARLTSQVSHPPGAPVAAEMGDTTQNPAGDPIELDTHAPSDQTHTPSLYSIKYTTYYIRSFKHHRRCTNTQQSICKQTINTTDFTQLYLLGSAKNNRCAWFLIHLYYKGKNWQDNLHLLFSTEENHMGFGALVWIIMTYSNFYFWGERFL